MSDAALLSPEELAAEYKRKRRLVTVKEVASSDLPFRVTKEKTGVILGSFETKGQADDFIRDYPLAQLEIRPTRRRSNRS